MNKELIKHLDIILKTIREREKLYSINLITYKVEKEAFDYLENWLKRDRDMTEEKETNWKMTLKKQMQIKEWCGRWKMLFVVTISFLYFIVFLLKIN